MKTLEDRDAAPLLRWALKYVRNSPNPLRDSRRPTALKRPIALFGLRLYVRDADLKNNDGSSSVNAYFINSDMLNSNL
jgi:hypothetical protein